jgi:hypothetical protein
MRRKSPNREPTADIASGEGGDWRTSVEGAAGEVSEGGEGAAGKGDEGTKMGSTVRSGMLQPEAIGGRNDKVDDEE